MFAFFIYSLFKLFMWLEKERSLKSFFRYFKEPFIISLLILWIVRVVSLINSINLNASVFLLGFFTTIVALGIVLYIYYIDNPQQLVRYVRYYIYIVFGSCVVALIQLVLYIKYNIIFGGLWNVPGHLPRIGALFWDVNLFGGLISGVLPILGVIFLISKGIKKKIFYTALFIPMTLVLIMTNSRTAWINAAVSFLVFITILLIRRFKLKGIVSVVLALIIISIPIMIGYNIKSSPFRAVIKQYFHYRIDSFDSHILLLKGSGEVFQKFPYIGGGYGSFFEHFSKTKIAAEFFNRDPAALSVRVPPHTIWGELVAETGIFGLSVFVIFILIGLLPLLYVSLKYEDKEKYLLSASMCAAIVGWLTGGIFYSYNSEFYFLLLFFFFIYGFGVMGRENISKTYNYFFNSNKLAILIVALLAIILIFSGLGKNHLLPWDEAIYAKISKNMVISHNYLIQSWEEPKVWYEKPPLYMWFMALSMRVLGFGSFAARLPSAIFGFGTIILVYLFGKKLFNKTTGFISAIALLTTFNFLYYARSSMLDVTTTFFITLAVYTYWLNKERGSKTTFLISAVSTGLAIMTKGVVGFIPYAVICLYELYLLITGNIKLGPKCIGKYLLYFLVSALVFLPWHIFMYIKFGQAFIQNYVIYHVFDRATQAIEDKGQPFFWYLEVMKVSMRIWFVALIPAFPIAVYKALKKSPAHVLLVIWTVIVFILFSVAKSKLKWYIIPIYPPTAIITAYFIERTFNFVLKKVKVSWLLTCRFLVLYILVVFSLFYLFLNRGLVYESDLTGAQAILLQEKDQLFGTTSMIYADRINLPLILYYSDSPNMVVDFGPLKEKLSEVDKYDYVVFITKESRFRKLSETYSLQLIDTQQEWVLGFYSKKYMYDPVYKKITPAFQLSTP
jgi:4-amino-4-deoxy-L-arabinose transferase-like glycosyltransferase